MKTSKLLLGALAGLLCFGGMVEVRASIVNEKVNESTQDVGPEALISLIAKAERNETILAKDATLVNVFLNNEILQEGINATISSVEVLCDMKKLSNKQKSDVFCSLGCDLVGELTVDSVDSFKEENFRKRGNGPGGYVYRADVALLFLGKAWTLLGTVEPRDLPFASNLALTTIRGLHEKYGSNGTIWEQSSSFHK